MVNLTEIINRSRLIGEADQKYWRPSEYKDEASLTTEERARRLSRTSFCSANFEITPEILIFQGFIAGQVYSAVIRVRNTTEVSRCLRIGCDPDPCFSVQHRQSSSTRMIPPGLSRQYTVTFCPEKMQDYQYRVEFQTDSGSFAVPVVAVGPRPILDLPDQLELPLVPVRAVSSKPILLRNLGNATAVFNIRTSQRGFAVSPAIGSIRQKEALQFTITFHSDKPGHFAGLLFLEYESGEKVRTELKCFVTKCDIRIDDTDIQIQETYLGLSRSKTVTICNNSDFTVAFEFMQFKESEIDEKQRENYRKLFSLIQDMEVGRCRDLVYYDICSLDTHRLVSRRIERDQVASLRKESFRYAHTCFVLAPTSGEIRPRSMKEVTVFFRAMEIGEVRSVAYLEVTGSEARIPFELRGIGKGPVIQLGAVTIYTGDICLCATHNFAIVAVNKGSIEGTVAHTPRPTDFGGTIVVTPASLPLHPEQQKSFDLSLSSNRRGEFVERIDFVIEESQERISLHIKGCVVRPTLRFNQELLDFGTVPLGFRSERVACLRNLSETPVAFRITVLRDGDEPPLLYEEFATARTKPSFPLNPREFIVRPPDGLISARSSLKIKVIYTANIARTERTTMQLDIRDSYSNSDSNSNSNSNSSSDSEAVPLPIKFTGKVASLVLTPAEITIRFSYVNFPYSRSLVVENKSDVDGHFHLSPQTLSEDASICYSLSMHEGLVKAHRSKTIEISVIARELGSRSTAIQMLTMGEKSPVLACIVSCNGVGPVLSVEPTSLDFGEARLLREVEMRFSVVNDSPIPAYFSIGLEKKRGPWTMDRNSGELAPAESLEIPVKFYPRDAGKYSNSVTLAVANGRASSVRLTGTAVGHSILFQPDIFPVFDMGLFFGHEGVDRPITMTNLGTRNWQIVWSNQPEITVQRGQTILSESAKFNVSPSVFDAPPQVTKTVRCTVPSAVADSAEENWYVFGQADGLGKRQLIGVSTLRATFTQPRVTFDKTELFFRVDVCGLTDIVLEHQEELSLVNRSGLDLNVRLSIEPPFYLLTGTNGERLPTNRIPLIDAVITKVSIIFSPTFDDNSHSRSYKRVLRLEYDEHAGQDKIKCTGSLYLPELKIDPTNLIVDCELGSSAEETFVLTNTGPILVRYKFLWLQQFFTVKRGSLNDSELAALCMPPPPRPKDRTESKVETILTDEQNGSGDGPASSRIRIFPNGERPDRSGLYKLKECLAPIFEEYFEQDTELIDGLRSLRAEPSSVRFIDQALTILPSEGIILPYSSQRVYLRFEGGIHPMQIETQALCQIRNGPATEIKISARADITRFSLSGRVIDFGEQLLGRFTRKSLILKNESAKALPYKIDSRVRASREPIDRSDINSTRIEGGSGLVEPGSSVTVYIEHRPTVLGPVHLPLKLEVAHAGPIGLTVKSIGTFPQLYLLAPERNQPSNDYPPIFGYNAIQTLTTELLVSKWENALHVLTRDNLTEEKNSLSEEEIAQLEAEGWSVVLPTTEGLPAPMDIELAFERYLAIKLIDESPDILRAHIDAAKKQPIPRLFSSECVIDMGYVIVGLSQQYSTVLLNCGCWHAELRMKKISRKAELTNSGIAVELRKAAARLPPGASIPVHITWHPLPENFTERATTVRHTIYFEVIDGCTIPVTIKGIVTYPCVSVSTGTLDFRDVIVGEYLPMQLTVKNDGLVDCHWTGKLESHRKKESVLSFHICRDSNQVCPPAHSEIIDVYFQPLAPGLAEAKFIINVEMGMQALSVRLRGRGTEKKLTILHPNINFSPVVPFTVIQERTFTVENSCEYTAEFFWNRSSSPFEPENGDQAGGEWSTVFKLVPLPPIVETSRTTNESIVDQDHYDDRSGSRGTGGRVGSRMYNASLGSDLMSRSAVNPVTSILQPGEAQKFRVSFSPGRPGNYQHSYSFTLLAGTNVNYLVNVSGIADIPRLEKNPHLVFPKVKRNNLHDLNEPTYILDGGFFDFGPILVLPLDKRVHERVARMKLRNVSSVDAQVHCFPAQNCSDCFNVQPGVLIVPAGESEWLTVRATATKLGPLSERLFLSVRNNPEVDTIELRSTGVKLDIELEGKTISFGRVFLRRRESRGLTVRNKCGIGVLWRVRPENPAESEVSFTPVKGTINPRSEQSIEVCYYGAEIPHAITTRTFILEALLHERDQDPILAETIVVSGETSELAVDVHYANPIDFKSVQVDWPATASFLVRNRGHYPVKYAINTEQGEQRVGKVGREAFLKLKNSIRVAPSFGSLQSEAEATIQVTITPNTEIALKKCPLLKCCLTDADKQTPIEEIPLTISIVAYYARFRVHPYPLVDFETICVSTSKTLYLSIENTGNFPLRYYVSAGSNEPASANPSNQRIKENLGKKEVTDAASRKDKKSSRKERTAKSETDSAGLVKIGPFTVTKSEGRVEAGTIETIPINCYTEEIGVHESEIRILVPEAVPGERTGKTVTLCVDSRLPSVRPYEHRRMFRDSFHTEHLRTPYCPLEVLAGPHTVFARQENRLYFRKIALSGTYTTNLYVYNRSVIPANVELEVLFPPGSLTPKTVKPAFDVSPQRECVSGNSYRTFVLSFAPTIHQSHVAVLLMKTELPPRFSEQETMEVRLIGEASVPRIEMVEPTPTPTPTSTRQHGERLTLSFEQTFVNERGTKEFAFKNTGEIQARVLLEISQDPNGWFDIGAAAGTETLSAWDYNYNVSSDRCTVTRLMPGRVARFVAKFCPRQIGKYTGEIRLLLLDNPDDALRIELEAEGYFGSVILQGLPVLRPENEKPSPGIRGVSNRRSRKNGSRKSSFLSGSGTTTVAPLTYHLNYGGCFIGRMYRKSFKITNKSADRWFRFEFGAHPDIVIAPSAGHLNHGASKEITATFLASEPKNHANVRIECLLAEIEIEIEIGPKVADSLPEIAWDDRETETRWEEMDSGSAVAAKTADGLPSIKAEEPTIEPEHRPVLRSSAAPSIRLLVNATAAYTLYSCSIDKQIRFEDTFMFQRRQHRFTLSNPGTVAMAYSWRATMDEQYPRRLSQGNAKSVSTKSEIEKRSDRNTASSNGITSDRANEPADIQPRRLVDGTNKKKQSSSGSYRASDLFSSAAGLTERTADSWIETDDFPFTVFPTEGLLLPEQSVECTIQFAPMNVFSYKAYLICSIENLSPDVGEPIIPVLGRSFLPYCHFDVEESDYAIGAREDGGGVTDPRLENDPRDTVLRQDIAVIEFKVVGTRAPTLLKRFGLINPSAEDYRFWWRESTRRRSSEKLFECLVPEGIAERGKRTELAFRFLAPARVGLFQSLWLFSIQRYNLERAFLLNVLRDLGGTARGSVTIINNEKSPIPFRISERSLYSEDKLQKLTVTPKTGTFLPQTEMTLWAEYRATRVGQFQFSIECLAKITKDPFIIFVTGSAFQGTNRAQHQHQPLSH